MNKNNVINLNTHSYYSLLSSTLSIDKIIDFAIKNNQEYVSLIDNNVLYGAMEFYQKATQNNLKPIIGIQIDYKNSNLILIAKNNIGFHKLIKISSFIMCNHTYNLDDFLCENVFVILINGDFYWNHKNFYVNNQIDKPNSIACHEVFYSEPKDYPVYIILNAIKKDIKITHLNINETNNNNCFWLNNEFNENYDSNSINNLIELVSQCNWVIDDDINENTLKYPNKLNMSSDLYLKELCTNSLNQYLNKNEIQNKNEYYERLEYELKIINQKNFNDYFLVVQDYVNWAKLNNIIIGPGRGSAAGSLVSFLLNITEIDPLKYNLLFERFLNYERNSMPDIDIDIMDIKRDELINYLYNKYGNDHVCNIITFSHIKARQAIRDVGRILNININIIDKICRNISSKYDNDILTAIENNKILHDEYLQNPELFELSHKILNIPRQVSMHAAGIILSNKSITDIIPIQKTFENRLLTQYSMDYLEQLGLIKMDLLGLKNLTILYFILVLIEKKYNKKINLLDIDLNDQNVLELFTLGRTNGIFQFESYGMKRLLKKMKPKNIEDLSLVSAMYRPGAVGNIDNYFNRRLNNIHPNYINNEIKKILEPTYGVFVYQEQIIEIVKTMANFSGSKSDNFRRAISKKKENEIKKLKIDFINGALKNNYKIDEINNMFEYIKEFGNYGFNHSHSISYSILSYWIAYLKYYYPIETLSILMSYGDDNKEKLINYVQEAQNYNIKVMGPNINISTNSFIINNNSIIFSLLSIKGLGIEIAKKIIELRNKMESKKFNNPLVAIALLYQNGVTHKCIESLIKCGAFDCFNKLQRCYLLENLDILTNKNCILDKNYNFIFDLKLKYVDENYDLYPIYETEILGISFFPSKYILYKEKYQKKYNLEEIWNHTEQTFNTLIQIKNIYKNVSKNGKNYLKINIIQDQTTDDIYVFENVDYIYNELLNYQFAIVNVTKKNNNYIILNVKLSLKD